MTVPDQNTGVANIGGSPVDIVSLVPPTADEYTAPAVINGNVRKRIMLADPTTGAPVDIIGLINGVVSGNVTWGGIGGSLANQTDLNNALAAKAPLAGPNLTGTPTAPTAPADTNTTQLATTAFVIGQASAANPIMDGVAAVGTSKRYARADHVHPTDTTLAPKASPTFTGTPVAPTAAVDTNTTQIATTAFYAGQASSTNPVMNGNAAVGTSLRFARTDHVHPSDTAKAGTSQTFSIGVYVASVSDGDLARLRAPFALTVTKTTCKTVGGTTSVTTKNGASSLGTAVSASTTESSQTYSGSFAAGDYIVLSAASSATCTGLTIEVDYTRTLA